VRRYDERPRRALALLDRQQGKEVARALAAIREHRFGRSVVCCGMVEVAADVTMMACVPFAATEQEMLEFIGRYGP
jgi:hypothetical protein